jgi:hypothetical protein
MKRSAMRPKPPSERKQAIMDADRAISQACLARDKHICQMCGGKATDAHHIIHRRNRVLRWVLKNVVSLCRACHSLEGTAQRWKLDELLIKWLGGIDEYEALRLSAHTDESETPEQAIERLKSDSRI